MVSMVGEYVCSVGFSVDHGTVRRAFMSSSRPPPPPPSSSSQPLVDSSSDEEGVESQTSISPDRIKELNASGRRPSTVLDSETRRSYKSLEDELERVKKKLLHTQKENEAVKLSLIELHKEKKQLQLQVDIAGQGDKNEAMQRESIASAVREKELEKLLLKAKRDKEKALRLVVSLIGRDKVLEHLQKHDGKEDILDALVASFSSSKLVENRSMRSTASSNKKQKHPSFVGLNNKMLNVNLKGQRSRSAERTRSIWMSVKR